MSPRDRLAPRCGCSSWLRGVFRARATAPPAKAFPPPPLAGAARSLPAAVPPTPLNQGAASGARARAGHTGAVPAPPGNQRPPPGSRSRGLATGARPWPGRQPAAPQARLPGAGPRPRPARGGRGEGHRRHRGPGTPATAPAAATPPPAPRRILLDCLLFSEGAAAGAEAPTNGERRCPDGRRPPANGRRGRAPAVTRGSRA